MQTLSYVKKHVFFLSLFFSFFMHVVYLACFSLQITYDGMDYLHMISILFRENMLTEWNFIRTPFFPAALKIFFIIFGDNPISAVLCLSFFGFVSITLLGIVFKRLLGVSAAAAIVLLLTFYPLLITYEHMLLMETCIGCAMILLTAVLLSDFRNHWTHAVVITLIVSLMYYIKPNLVYMAPVCGLLLVVSVVLKNRTVQSFRLNVFGKLAAMFLIITIVPFIAAQPWETLGKGKSDGPKRAFLFAGLLIQGVIPPENKIISDHKKEYLKALDFNTRDGVFQIQGIIGSPEFYPLLGALAIKSDSNLKDYMEILLANPSGYLRGFYNNVKIMLDFRHKYDETQTFTAGLLNSERSSFPESYRNSTLSKEIREKFSYYTGSNVISKLLKILLPLYKIFLVTGWICTLFCFFIGVYKRQFDFIILSLLPFTYAAMHLLVLLSSARYFFPINLIVIANNVFVIFYLIKLRQAGFERQMPENQSV